MAIYYHSPYNYGAKMFTPSFRGYHYNTNSTNATAIDQIPIYITTDWATNMPDIEPDINIDQLFDAVFEE